ncbi:MAG: flagellar basal body P-ring formation chaperone FlgA [Caulobacteraceae bacterium]|nr:flagellar basal body P-ring formation chaperone FlgA [Caulobacteraceae bacterium]
MRGGRLHGWSLRAAPLALACALMAAPPTLAGQPVTLKTQVSSGRTVTLGDLFDGAGAAASAVVGNGAPPGESAVLDAAVVRELARQHGLDWDNAEGIARIVVPRTPIQAAAHMVEALTYARSLSSGETVQASDLTFSKVASFAVPPDAPRDAQDVIGKLARRPLRSGSPVAAHDVAAPQVIKTNDVVQVIYRSDGVNLALQGKAMGSATLGEPVDIMNPVSKKVIQAIASGPDQAVVGPEAEQLRNRPLASSAQIADLR